MIFQGWVFMNKAELLSQKSQGNKNSNVPKLRFPEFTGEWQEKKLDDIFSGKKGQGLSKSDIDKNGQNKCILYGELYTKYSETIDNVISRTNLNIGVKSKAGDLLVPCSTTTTNIDLANVTVINENNVLLGGDISILRFKKNGNSVFFAYYLTHPKKFDLAKYGQGSTIVHLYYNHFKKMSLCVPAFVKEQKKIAACLSSLDELITTQTQKIESLKTHKKGLMQQLFPVEGKTIPKLRFPEFENDKEWVVKPLKEVFSIFQGYSFSSNNSVDKGTRWLKIADVSIQKMNHKAPSFLPFEYCETFSKFLIKKGDYVLALTRPILNSKLKISAVDDLLHNSLLNQRVGKLVSNENLTLVYNLLQTNYLIDEIEKSIAGSEPPNLSMKQIESISIAIPKESKEQTKIAACLSSLDDLITRQTQKLESLKTHKKGLMQQLFPNTDEING